VSVLHVLADFCPMAAQSWAFKGSVFKRSRHLGWH